MSLDPTTCATRSACCSSTSDDIAKMQGGDVERRLLAELQATVRGEPWRARRRPMLADNVVHFARVLRDAGLPVGPDRVLAALAAIEAVGLGPARRRPRRARRR